MIGRDYVRNNIITMKTLSIQVALSIFCTLIMPVSLHLSAQTIAEGTYIIKSCVDNNHVVDLNNSVTQDGNNIHIWTNNNTNAQRWLVKHSDGAIVMRSAIDNNFVIDLNSSIAQDGNNIYIWHYNGTDAQRWFPQYENGAYILRSAVNQNFVLDLNNSNISDGNNIHIWTFNGTDAQRWIFQRVDGGTSNNGGTTVIIDNSPMPCVGCGGTKKCSVCNGKGYTVSASTRRMYTECGGCNGTGICQACRFQ